MTQHDMNEFFFKE